MANIKISQLPNGIPTPTSIFPFVDGGQTYQGAISALTSNSTVEVTYSELVDNITGETLNTGSFYIITDFRTCYDQPDFDYNNNSITGDNYKQAAIEPIVVLATSANTISTTAYQPSYPNDRIQYDWTFSATEVTNEVAYGRISERIDEFNNRTDYDHRTILFKRYDNYYYEETDIATGTIELIENTGEVIGTETVFSDYNTGDYIAIPNTDVTFFEIVSISGDTSMVVSGLTIPSVSAGASFYSAQKAGITYKQNNISSGYTENPTFLFDNETIISNYIGDVAMFRNWNGNDFLLPNNVFGEDVIGNRIGNNFINNTFSRDVEHNVIGDDFENNTIDNDSDFIENQIGTNFRNNLIICEDFNDNVIGDGFSDNKIFNNNNFVDNQIGVGFNNNTISDNFGDNKIGNGFDYNVINGLFVANSIGNQFNGNNIYSGFYDNLIAKNFNNNEIYSDFYKNEILIDFNNNTIGNSVDLSNFEFYRNYIRNNFNNNIIRQDFQNNQIGTNFQENTINGEFINNTILNGYNQNTIGNYFSANNIGNGFNENTVYENFNENTIGNYFGNNLISNNFYNNNIGTNFESNEPSNVNLFGWNNLSTVSTRTYDTLRISLNNAVGNYIIGQELVMRVISTSQYFKFKFTQWTQNGNGGGFQYERQELDSSGNTIGSLITFIKTNYGSEVDVIVEGVVELTRDSEGGLYNTITDTPPFNNNWPGPGDTEWNSIYTQLNNGENFRYNTIGNSFNNNIIGNDFQHNQIGNRFEDNTIGEGFGFGNNESQGNRIGNYFRENIVGEYFYNNIIPDNFVNNNIYNLFQWNNVQSLIQNTTLTSCPLYSGVTVNVFKNGNEDNRLSYYDELDVLTIDSLTGLCNVISFTITSSDFTSGNDIDGDTTPLGDNGVDGFENTSSQSTLYAGYRGTGLGGTSLSELTVAYNALEFDLNNSTGYVWNVTWGEGSSIGSGLVKFGSIVNNQDFRIQTIDENDTDWQIPNTDSGTSLVGTFLFPATFTIYLPLTNKSVWC